MSMGIIGAGNIGGTLARRWMQAGHEVAVSNSRGPASHAALVAELGPRARALYTGETRGDERKEKRGDAPTRAWPARSGLTP